MSIEEAEDLDEDRLEVTLLEEAAEGRNKEVKLICLSINPKMYSWMALLTNLITEAEAAIS